MVLSSIGDEMASEKKAWYLDRLVNVAALFIAIVALLLSWQANKLSKESNNIANEANRIALSNTSANIRATLTRSYPLYTHACTSGAGQHLRKAKVQTSVRFSNIGGLPVSLDSVRIIDTNFSLFVEAFERDYVADLPRDDNRINLPLDIMPGVSREWTFSASGSSPSSEIELEYETVREPLLKWAFDFSDGSTIILEHAKFSEDYPDFSRLMFDGSC
jgi:hypothetical protein